MSSQLREIVHAAGAERVRAFDRPAFGVAIAELVVRRLGTPPRPGATFVAPPERHGMARPDPADDLPPPPAWLDEADLDRAQADPADDGAGSGPAGARLAWDDHGIAIEADDDLIVEEEDFDEIVDETFGPSADELDDGEVAAQAERRAAPVDIDTEDLIEAVVEQAPPKFEPLVLADPGDDGHEIDFDDGADPERSQPLDEDLPGEHRSVAEDLARFFDDEAPGPAEDSVSFASLGDASSGGAGEHPAREQDVRSSVKKLFRRD